MSWGKDTRRCPTGSGLTADSLQGPRAAETLMHIQGDVFGRPAGSLSGFDAHATHPRVFRWRVVWNVGRQEWRNFVRPGPLASRSSTRTGWREMATMLRQDTP